MLVIADFPDNGYLIYCNVCNLVIFILQMQHAAVYFYDFSAKAGSADAEYVQFPTCHPGKKFLHDLLLKSVTSNES